jgi:hypothetical protein
MEELYVEGLATQAAPSHASTTREGVAKPATAPSAYDRAHDQVT